MTGSDELPRLTANNYRVTSPASGQYNCIAWAAGDTENWWQPGVYWLPADWPKNDVGAAALQQLFVGLGFQACGMDVALEAGFEKVALYTDGQFYTHAARQLPGGKWTSKLGKDVDIEHDAPDDLVGGIYGEVMQVMKRPVQGAA
jgi:hypothetical protein